MLSLVGKVQLHIGPGGHDSMDAFLDEIPRVAAYLQRSCSRQA
jgi:hypothetical protein